MEKRISERISTSLKVKLSWGNEINSAVITNLSKDGMLINSEICIPIESKFDVLIHQNEGMLKVPAKVRRLSKTGNEYDGMGVELSNPSAQYIDFINSLKKNLKTDKPKASSFICNACNYIAFDQAPTNCPFCRASIDRFSNASRAVRTPEDFESLGEFEKKHFPVITVSKEYDSKQQCRFTDMHVKIGEVPHNVDIDDHITFVDFYLDEANLNKECIARINLNCRRMSPQTSLRLNNITAGGVTIVSHCKAHGSWMSEINL
jgi:desulfoferrodoxin (superoxide reductase-like protein)